MTWSLGILLTRGILSWLLAFLSSVYFSVFVEFLFLILLVLQNIFLTSKQLKLCLYNCCHFRVSARRDGASTISVLSIASSLASDSGNYTCAVPDTDLITNIQIIIQKEFSCYIALNILLYPWTPKKNHSEWTLNDNEEGCTFSEIHFGPFFTKWNPI